MAALVVFVFVLAMGAKLSQYDPPHPGSINPAAASKLWVSGEKLKSAVPGSLALPWLAAFLFFSPPARRILCSEPGWKPALRHSSLGELYRFLRPPPVF
ncbi:MAG TPA: hypothetical protein VMT05_14635 [Terriglobales bacterium]|nr:hypothetical protein [Terriglobales bacterium]